MKDFYNKMAIIMEVDTANPTDILRDYEVWDSLAILSLIAMAQTDYKCRISKEDLDSLVTSGDLEMFIRNRLAE